MKKMLGLILAGVVGLAGCSPSASAAGDTAQTMAAQIYMEPPDVSSDNTEPENFPKNRIAAESDAIIFSIPEESEDALSVAQPFGMEETQLAVRFTPVFQHEQTEQQEELFSSSCYYPTFEISDPADADWIDSQMLQIHRNTQETNDEILTQARVSYQDSTENPDLLFYAYSHYTDMKVARMDSHIISLLQMDSTYSGGAHPNNTQHAYNFDLRQHEQLTLQDILFDGAGEQLLQMLLDQLDQRMDSLELSGLYPEYRDIIISLFKTTPFTDNWYFTRSGLVIYFNSYDIAPHAAGAIKVEFPYDVLSDILLPDYLPEPVIIADDASVQLLDEQGSRSILSVSEEDSDFVLLAGTEGLILDLRLYQLNGWFSENTPILGSLLFAANQLSQQQALSVPIPENTEYLLIYSSASEHKTACVFSRDGLRMIPEVILNQSN